MFCHSAKGAYWRFGVNDIFWLLNIHVTGITLQPHYASLEASLIKDGVQKVRHIR